VRGEVAKIKAELATGRYQQGLAAIAPVVVEATALNYQPLIAEVELLHGSLAWRSDRADEAAPALLRSIASGEAGRAGDVTAEAWLELVWFIGQERQRPAEALRLGKLAQGAVDRYAGGSGLNASLAERLGVTALDLGKLDDAEPNLVRAYELRRDHYGGDDHPDVAASLQHLAMLASARGDHATAIERHRRAYDIIEKGLGEDHPHTEIALNGLAAELQLAGRSAEALPLFRRGLAIVERTAGPEAFDAAMYHYNMGLALTDLGRHDEAIALQRRARAIYLEVRGPDSVDVTNHRAELARALHLGGHLDEAIAEYREAVIAIERISGGDAKELATALTGFGLTLVDAKRPRDAEPVLRRALEIRERTGETEYARQLRADLSKLR
jgi:tetratricopeptide (TPR) repeat protein